jgi:hypothetical protein
MMSSHCLYADMDLFRYMYFLSGSPRMCGSSTVELPSSSVSVYFGSEDSDSVEYDISLSLLYSLHIS